MRSGKHLLILSSLFLVLFVSCKKVTIRTILYWDSSFERTISVSGDSSGADDTAYPFPQQNDWEMMHHKEHGDYTYMIRKDFTNAQALNREFAYREDTVKVNAVVKMDKKLRWFYTFYRYEETFFRFFPFNGEDLHNFVTKEEMQRYYAGNDSTDIEERLEEYAKHAMFNEFYDAFVRAVQSSTIKLNATKLDQQKEQLYQLVMQWEFFENDLDFAQHFLQSCETVYGTSYAFLRLEPELASINQKYIDYYEFISEIFGEDYRVEVLMPGRVLDTNANSDVKNDQAVWEFSADDFHYRDYVMWVESRRLNILPTVLAGFFILAGLVLLWLSARRARRQRLTAQGIAWRDRKRFVLRWWLSAILLVVGLAMSIMSLWLLFLFHSEPPFFFLDIFNPSPAENALVVATSIVGTLLIIIGSYQIILYAKTKNASK